tara:strand:- start:1523 stop:1975 length:453 start_codon:yes stop_codon:yes gene_type:complete
MSLQRLFYTSRIVDTEARRGEALAREIAEQSAIRNAACGLTGSLVYIDDHFMQVIEGEESAVEITFERICRDFRHYDVKLIDLQLIPSRQFATWGMACLIAERESSPVRREVLSEIRLTAGLNARQAIEQIRAMLDERDKSDAVAALISS